ncbi:MAG: Wzz/FepE/Etk N-terminal domain-containing protein [Roseateles asaccharophilus]|uniref:Capsule polysaccharide export protein KpsE/RkpR n=1 Tax=Roseateles asaccharophilus TaxID=582607 RepID=A0A4R6MYB8_9BURK|nr:Wzz/FepE/Etk N-terminal domain-containing protein [Roseateles asaccharophilus]MDN3545712.1 Wzz/FepE/Etk N-terminal domain-containing protein [Roseateles asaccharophilus]TDP07581.1 capsule polysaccharide export protein KpsE/RkpR [Roseateles asaccharophilus]
MTQNNNAQPQAHPADHNPWNEDEGVDLLELGSHLLNKWKLLVSVPLLVGTLTLGGTYLIKPTFTAQTIFLPPQQQQSSAASALASLGALAGLAGGAGSLKTPGDQYVSLMQSANVEDRIIDRFKLMALYEAKFRFEARKELEQNVRISLGKKDGLITVEADAKDPQLAADMANQYVAELRRLTSELALTEAQQRRAFFETELKNTKTKLAEAQQALQSGGFNAGAIKAEPKAAAENYAQLKAQLTAAEVRLQALRRTRTDTAPEVQQQASLVAALHGQLVKLTTKTDDSPSADYVSRYREYKYQEALFELFSKQYEIARLDESRDGGSIQVIDVATPPELKSKPRRAITAGIAWLLALTATSIFFIVNHRKRPT